MKRESLTRVAVFCALVGIAVAVRLVSETPNFNAVSAAALFAGFYFRHRLTAVCVPLAAMVISDQFLGGYAKPMMAAVYGSLLVPILWRPLLRGRLTGARVALGSISSSLAFFVLSNAAVWFAWYPHGWAGLVRCYTLAVPFFGNALASDLLFSASFFGAYLLASQAQPSPAGGLAPSAA